MPFSAAAAARSENLADGDWRWRLTIFGTKTSTMTMTKPPNMARRCRPQTRTGHVVLISISAFGAVGTEVLAYTPSPPLVVPRRQIRRNAANCSIRRTSSSSGRGPLRSTAASLSDLSPISSSATSPATDATATTGSSNNSQSRAALWHKQRRRQMLEKYGDQIIPLERDASSQSTGVPLLLFANAALLMLAVWSGSLPPLKVTKSPYQSSSSPSLKSSISLLAVGILRVLQQRGPSSP